MKYIICFFRCGLKVIPKLSLTEFQIDSNKVRAHGGAN